MRNAQRIRSNLNASENATCTELHPVSFPFLSLLSSKKRYSFTTKNHQSEPHSSLTNLHSSQRCQSSQSSLFVNIIIWQMSQLTLSAVPKRSVTSAIQRFIHFFSEIDESRCFNTSVNKTASRTTAEVARQLKLLRRKGLIDEILIYNGEQETRHANKSVANRKRVNYFK